MGTKKDTEYLKYQFTDEEKRDIATEMAQKVAEFQQTEREKKAIDSDLKSQMDGLQAKINNSAVKINNGYEMRSVDIEIVPDFEKKAWRYVRTDTGEEYKTKDMSTEDLQMDFTEEAA